MSESDKERVKFNTEIIKLLVLMFLATGGGTVSLILNFKSATHGVLAAFGMLISLICGILAIFVFRQTEKLLK